MNSSRDFQLRIRHAPAAVPAPFAGLDPAFAPSNAIDLAIILTSRCQGACAHCYNESGPRRREELPFDQLASVINSGLFAGRPIRRVAFSGGEPLLYNGLDELIELAAQKSLEPSCVSGAIGISTNRYHQIARAGCKKMVISWDRYHERFVPRSTFVRLLDELVTLFPDLTVQMAYSEPEAGRQDAVELLSDLHTAVTITLFPVQSVGRARSFYQRHPMGESSSASSAACEVTAINYDGKVYNNCEVSGFTESRYLGILSELIV